MRDYLGISEIGQCQRRVFYAHQPELEPQFTPEAQRKMDLGHLVETLRRRELRREGLRVYAPQREVAFGPARGHIDGYLKSQPCPVLWECKSTTSFSIAKWMKGGLPRHISFQVHGYMAGLSDVLAEYVTRCQIEVVDRTSGEVHTWPYEGDPLITQAARERAVLLAAALSDGKIPEREFDGTSSDCKYCPFRSTCRPDVEIPEATKDCTDAESWEGFSEAIELYVAGQELKEEGEELVSRARESIQSQLQGHHATKARVKGALVLWSQVETTRFDGKALQAKLPEIYAQYLKPSSYHRLEVRR